jgi:MATE family multidrug resistance protein
LSAVTRDAAAPGPTGIAGNGSMRRRVLGLAWPVIGENLLQTLLGIVDTLLVARLGAEALAGVGSSLQVMFLVIGVLASVSVGSSILVSQAIGARERRQANLVAKQALVWGGLLAIPLSLIGWALAEPISQWLGLPAEVAVITADYLRITLGGALFLVLMYVSGGLLRGAGDSRTPMMASLVANVINAGLAFLLIFGHLGLPALGTQGSAWAALVGRATATLLLLAALCWGGRVISVWSAWGWRPSLSVAGRILRLGVPAAMEQALITLGFTWFTALMASQGTAALAAQRIAFNALSLSFLPGIGFGLATTALVGMAAGARRIDEAAAAAAVAGRWAAGWMGTAGLVYLILAVPIVGLFTSDAAVIEEGAPMMRFIALAQAAWAVVFVYSGALRGLGNTRFPLVANTLSVWAIVLLGYLLIHGLGTPAMMAWVGFAVISPLMAVLVWWRFSRAVSTWSPDAVVTPRAGRPAPEPADA